jgi:tetratricopeptide (TPR) repeat protein
MSLAQPWFGFGPGTFADVFPSFRPASLWNALILFTHNEYLHVAVECGLPALGLALLFLWTLLRETGKGILQTRPFEAGPQAGLASETAFFVLLLEAVHIFFDFTLHDWSHLFLVLAFATYALKEKGAADDVQLSLHLSRRAQLVGSALLSLLLLWGMGVGGLRDHLSRLYHLRALDAQRQGDLAVSENFAKRSVTLRPFYMDPWNLLGAIEDARGETSADPKKRKKHFQLSEGYYQKAVELSPYSLELLENRVRLMRVQRRLNQALDLQNQLVERAPHYPVGRIHQGEILLQMGRADEAVASAQKAIDLDYAFVPGYLLKAQAMEALGKQKDALKVYREVQGILESLRLKDLSGRIESNIRRLQSGP